MRSASLKSIKLIRTLLYVLAVLIIVALPAQVHIDADNSIAGDSIDIMISRSKALVNLKILRGNEKGELNLHNEITRREMIVLVNRMMAYDYHEDENSGNQPDIPFKDISQEDWAYNDIRIALKYSLIKGYTDNTLRPDNCISFAEACALIIRALGYENTIDKKWPEGVLEKSKELGLDKNLDIPADRIITRGEASVLIYNALSINFVE